MRIELTNYQPQRVPPENLPPALGEKLWQLFDQQSHKLHVEFPSPRTNGQWQITPQGWVGTIPLSPTLHIHIAPRLPVANLFQMLARVHQWESLPGQITTTALPDLFQQLAHLLATAVQQRARHGLFQAYLPQQTSLPYLRGQLNVRQLATAVSPATIPCRFQQRTPDLPHNQILAYTLHTLARSGLLAADTQTAVRRAYRILTPRISLRPFTSSDILPLTYTRLNADYRPLHAICRFFLDHLGPSHHSGSWEMVPFLVDMNRLFEQFVASWLAAHLPAPWQLRRQESVILGTQGEIELRPDLVLYDGNGRVAAILDTKYKAPTRIATTDFSQVVTYAKARHAPEAILIYPVAPERPLHITVGGDLQVRSLTFPLDDDLDSAGHALLNAILTPRHSSG